MADAASPRAGPTGLLVRQADTPAFLGLSRSALYRLRPDPAAGFPEPLTLPCGGMFFKRVELERWINRLARGRARRKRPTQSARR